MLDDGNTTVAFQHFDSAFDLIKSILDEGTLLFLPYLYHMFLTKKYTYRKEVLLKMLAFISQMIHLRFPHLRLIKKSLVLLHGMDNEQRDNCSVRVFQSLSDQLIAVFHDDIPSEYQLREAAKQLCLPVKGFSGQDKNESDGYKLTTLAVWKLAKDAELLETSTANEPVSRDQYATDEIYYYSGFESHRDVPHFLCNGSHLTRPRYNSHWRSNAKDLYSHFYSGGSQLESFSAAPWSVDMGSFSEGSLLRENQKPRRHVAFRTKVRRLGGRLSQVFGFK
ncbi:hypothetical protein N431DRAFT_457795 [Stipitochalara longipes BDJ]|nr:hypothetical protein N431DRAFT_457795 [Stipitochalara longipes BDJ]